MKLIGLTGGIASGKSLLESMFRRAGIPVIDADELSREVTGPGTPGLAAILSHFGKQFALPDGSLDRKSLARLVFANEQARIELEQIVHPLIALAMQAHVDRYVNEGNEECVYCAPLIFEKNLADIFEAIILVYCDEETQLERLIQRDHLSMDEAKLRLSAQMPLREKKKRTPYQIDNNKTKVHTAKQLSAMWREITGKSVTFAP